MQLSRRTSALALVLLAGACSPEPDEAPTDHPDVPDAAAGPDGLDESEGAYERPPRPALLPELAEGQAGGQLDPNRPGFQWDPVTYLARRPNLEFDMQNYVEAPGGTVHVRTNSYGMREDTDPAPGPVDLRILVAGDSHTEGAVDNRHSFANVLEARLGQAREGRSVEVWNAGVAYCSFPNYLGTLYKYLPMRPDAFVMAVYTGNDFGAMYELAARLAGESLDVPPAEYWQRIEGASGIELGHLSGLQGVSQAWNQLWHYACYPERVESTLQDALAFTREVARLCEVEGIRLLVLGIPTAAEIEPQRFAALREALDEHFELDEVERERNTELRLRYGRALEEAGVEWLDGTEVLRAAAERGEGPLYWIDDQHLAIEGHRVLAEALLERFAL